MARTRTLTFALVACALSVACAFGLCACGQTATSSSASTSTQTSQDAQANPDGKTLVVYYSATGSTAGVAMSIASQIDAPTFVIEPAEPYTSADLDYNNQDSRVSREHASGDFTNVALRATTPDDWASYETIILGYPIWWGEAAYPVASFVAANDWTDKQVIPFCTSASSGLGESDSKLADIAKGGVWLGGMRFPSNVASDEVRQWIDDLGLEPQNLQD